ncbi:hypothetical protein CBM2606_A110200 [Cupriavidus taiwanensis]|nr:hypothetical protein CBM2606_A110200 [Cupriavidus taiwanensis]
MSVTALNMSYLEDFMGLSLAPGLEETL